MTIHEYHLVWVWGQRCGVASKAAACSTCIRYGHQPASWLLDFQPSFLRTPWKKLGPCCPPWAPQMTLLYLTSVRSECHCFALTPFLDRFSGTLEFLWRSDDDSHAIHQAEKVCFPAKATTNPGKVHCHFAVCTLLFIPTLSALSCCRTHHSTQNHAVLLNKQYQTFLVMLLHCLCH